jgi:hypothetical protein
VLEVQARQLLVNSPQLKQTFAEKLAADAEFAASPKAIRDWFYRNSPYWDQKINIYPVGRIEDPEMLKQLHLK